MSKKSNSFTGMILKLMGALAVVAFLFGGICYGMGWITFEHNDQTDTSTVEVRGGEIQEAATDTVESRKQILKDAGEAIQNATEDLTTKEDATNQAIDSQQEAEQP